MIEDIIQTMSQESLLPKKSLADATGEVVSAFIKRIRKIAKLEEVTEEPFPWQSNEALKDQEARSDD